MWNKVAKQLNNCEYMSGIFRDHNRISVTNEIFTPTNLVIEILQKIDINNFAPGKTILDSACGDGQFLVGVKWIKVYNFNMAENIAIKDIYGVDIMKDNVLRCIERLGGGNVITGDTLNPSARLDGQTNIEHKLMEEWFGPPTLMSLFG